MRVNLFSCNDIHLVKNLFKMAEKKTLLTPQKYADVHVSLFADDVLLKYSFLHIYILCLANKL